MWKNCLISDFKVRLLFRNLDEIIWAECLATDHGLYFIVDGFAFFVELGSRVEFLSHKVFWWTGFESARGDLAHSSCVDFALLVLFSEEFWFRNVVVVCCLLEKHILNVLSTLEVGQNFLISVPLGHLEGRQTDIRLFQSVSSRHWNLVTLVFYKLFYIVVRLWFLLVNLFQKVVSLSPSTGFWLLNFSRFKKLIWLGLVKLRDLILQALIQIHIWLNLTFLGWVTCATAAPTYVAADVAPSVSMTAAHKSCSCHNTACGIGTICCSCTTFSVQIRQLQVLNFQILIPGIRSSSSIQ